MAIVDAFQALYSLSHRGLYALPNGFGKIRFGWSQFGYSNEKAGIYQMRKGKKSQITVLERHYRPTNPQTEKQQAWRAIFAQGQGAWNNLTASEKLEYNKRVYPPHMGGRERFMKEYLKAHKT